MTKFLILAFSVLALFNTNVADAQEAQSIRAKVKGMKSLPGYMPLYLDEENGKLYMVIDKWNQELLYVSSLSAGLGSNDIGLDRNRLGDDKIVVFERVGKKVLMKQPNYGFRAVTDDAAERRAVQESFAPSIQWSFTAEVQEDGAALVDATEFFIRDVLRIVPQLRRMNQGNYSLDKARSYINSPQTKNFPLNTEVDAVITLVNTDGTTGGFVRSVAASDDALTLRIHHSLVKLPDSGYQPRYFDARSSFIPVSYYDYATPITEPLEKKMIMRHRLQRKDPMAERSEAVKPIIYYLDNGTPEPIRSALLDGARWWNQAFEAAGYINAFRVEVLPDTADAMDIRYNMINWVHRSTRGWSYGSAVVDPRTGEIIKGNVTLGSLRVRQDYLIFSALLSPFENGTAPANNVMLQTALQRLRQLSAHEVGHTLGLMHNYASSVNDRASVMDYPHPLATLEPGGNINLASAYTTGIGEWDKVAINWGYRDFGSSANEAAQLPRILDEAYAKGLQFISDQDARAPGGLHPQAHLWDNERDAVKGLYDVLAVRKAAMKRFGINSITQHTPLAMLDDAFVPLYFYHRYQLEAVTKLVGGMQYSYALRNSTPETTTYLDKQTQQRAMRAILASLHPQVITVPESIRKLIPPRPAGYASSAELMNGKMGLSFDAFAPAETAADLPLSFLFNAQRLNRLVQQEGSVGYALKDVLKLMVDSVFKANPFKGEERLIQQQTAQVLLTYLLSASTNEAVSFLAKAQVLHSLNEIKNYAEAQSKIANADKGFHLLTLERLKSPEKAKPTMHAPIPPGAPIGCEDWFGF